MQLNRAYVISYEEWYGPKQKNLVRIISDQVLIES
jgi:hypothetical protein